MAVGDRVVEGLGQGLADAERLDRGLALFRRIAVGAVGGDGDRAVGAGLGACGGDRQGVAGSTSVSLVRTLPVTGGDRVFGDRRRVRHWPPGRRWCR